MKREKKMKEDTTRNRERGADMIEAEKTPQVTEKHQHNKLNHIVHILLFYSFYLSNVHLRNISCL